jgi:hypothetical protein
MKFVALGKAGEPDKVVRELLAGQRQAIGRRDGVGLPEPIPAEHFAELFMPREGPSNLKVSRSSMYGPREPWIDFEDGVIYHYGFVEAWSGIVVSAVEELAAPADPADALIQLPAEEDPQWLAPGKAAYRVMKDLWPQGVPPMRTADILRKANPRLKEMRRQGRLSLDVAELTRDTIDRVLRKRT